MAFRNPIEALRAKQALLLEEVEALRSERDTLEKDLARAREDARVDALLESRDGPQKKWKSGRFWLVALAILLALVVAYASSSPSTGFDAEMLFGRVVSAEGDAPVANQAPCTVFIEPLDDSKRFDTRMQVICDDRSVYGGEESGRMDCGWRGAMVVRCKDDDFSDQGGDPKLEFERRTWRLRIWDRKPTYELVLELDRVEGH